MSGRSFTWRPLLQRPALVGALLVLAGALTGLAVVLLPLVAWAVVGAAIALLLLVGPAHLRIGATVLAAVGSRLLVASRLFPESINFFHFPLALLTAVTAALQARTRSALQRALGFGLSGLLAVCFFSWIINGGQFIRPLGAWLVFAEPFLLIYALVADTPDARGLKALWGLALAIPFFQLPLAAYQALSRGLADHMQGFFIGLGAGAHVAGAVALVGSLICLARAVVAGRLEARLLWLLNSGLLFSMAVLADAKQVIVVFLPALALILFGLLRLRWTRVAFTLPVLASALLGAFSYYRPLQVVLDWTLISRGILGKVQAFAVIASRFSSRASGWIFGLGPGNSVSRVALMSLEGYIKPSSPIRLLGLVPSRTTIELWNITFSNWLFASSSVWSSASSWLGLLGDLGLAGLALYLWLHWSTWRWLKPAAGWTAQVARAVQLMCLLLGFMYSWLEEPGFMAPASLVIGLGLVSSRAREPGKKDESPADP